MIRTILIGKRSATITVAGFALGSLLLAASPAGAQTVNAPIVNAPYVDQQAVNDQQPAPTVTDPGVVTPGPTVHRTHNGWGGQTAPGWGGQTGPGWSGQTGPGWGGNTGESRVDRREAYQQQLIQQGIDDGSLTRGEARYLEREQGRIDRAEERMLADGRLSPWERQRLNQMQNRASRDIYRLENNNRTADGWGGNDHNGWGRHYNSGWGGNNGESRVDRREAYQEQRIQQGITDGSLTRGEARYLEREQGRIERAEGRMLADGRLSPWERQRLNQMQNQAGRDIYRLEHNNRTADGHTGSQAGWNGRDYGWHGNNPVGAGHYPGANGYNHGWGNGNSGGQGTATGGGTTTGGTTTTGTTGGTTTTGTTGHSGSGWRGTHSGGTGTATGGTTTPGTTTPGTTTTGTTPGTTTAGTTQGWQGNYARGGQPGAYRQPGAQAGARPSQPAAWQGQQQYRQPYAQGAQPQMRPPQAAPWQGQQFQQARMQAPQMQMRPNFNMAPRPGGLGGMVNRASFSAPRAAPRTR